MTTTSVRIAANRRNAQRSTGPRFGKARSRLNAVTHGLTGESLILPGDDPDAFQQRLDAWTAELAPCNAFEQDLVQKAVGFSWRLERAERVGAALLADQIATVPREEDRRRREEVEHLGRRLLPPPRRPVPGGDPGTGLDRASLGLPASPDDPDDPLRLVNRLESTAGGCRWLLDRWAALRPIVDGGRAGLRARWSRRSGCWASSRWKPPRIARCWRSSWPASPSTARGPTRSPRFASRSPSTRCSITAEQLRDGGLARPCPRRRRQAREVLREVVNAAVERLEELEAEHRAREAALAPIRLACLSFDDSPEGEWIRRQEGKYTRAVARIVGRLRGQSAGRGAGCSPRRTAGLSRSRRNGGCDRGGCSYRSRCGIWFGRSGNRRQPPKERALPSRDGPAQCLCTILQGRASRRAGSALAHRLGRNLALPKSPRVNSRWHRPCQRACPQPHRSSGSAKTKAPPRRCRRLRAGFSPHLPHPARRTLRQMEPAPVTVSTPTGADRTSTRANRWNRPDRRRGRIRGHGPSARPGLAGSARLRSKARRPWAGVAATAWRSGRAGGWPRSGSSCSSPRLSGQPTARLRRIGPRSPSRPSCIRVTPTADPVSRCLVRSARDCSPAP